VAQLTPEELDRMLVAADEAMKTAKRLRDEIQRQLMAARQRDQPHDTERHKVKVRRTARKKLR
jgi:hypothetical protein